MLRRFIEIVQKFGWLGLVGQPKRRVTAAGPWLAPVQLQEVGVRVQSVAAERPL